MSSEVVRCDAVIHTSAGSTRLLSGVRPYVSRTPPVYARVRGRWPSRKANFYRRRSRVIG